MQDTPTQDSGMVVHYADLDTSTLAAGYARDALEVLLENTEAQELLLRDYVLGIGYR